MIAANWEGLLRRKSEGFLIDPKEVSARAESVATPAQQAEEPLVDDEAPVDEADSTWQRWGEGARAALLALAVHKLLLGCMGLQLGRMHSGLSVCD